MSFRELVEKNAAIAAGAFEIKTLAEAMKGPIAIVFIHATWSGPSIQAWKILTTALAPLHKLPPIFVVDADGFKPPEALECLDSLPQGYGETFWIQQGHVIASLARYRDSDSTSVVEYSQSLVD